MIVSSFELLEMNEKRRALQQARARERGYSTVRYGKYGKEFDM